MCVNLNVRKHSDLNKGPSSDMSNRINMLVSQINAKIKQF